MSNRNQSSTRKQSKKRRTPTTSSAELVAGDDGGDLGGASGGASQRAVGHASSSTKRARKGKNGGVRKGNQLEELALAAAEKNLKKNLKKMKNLVPHGWAEAARALTEDDLDAAIRRGGAGAGAGAGVGPVAATTKRQAWCQRHDCERVRTWLQGSGNKRFCKIGNPSRWFHVTCGHCLLHCYCQAGAPATVPLWTVHCPVVQRSEEKMFADAVGVVLESGTCVLHTPDACQWLGALKRSMWVVMPAFEWTNSLLTVSPRAS